MNGSRVAAQLGLQGRALLEDYHQTGKTDYLDASIGHARQALEISLPHERFIYLNNLGNRLRERFEAYRNVEDISEAIDLVKLSLQTVSERSLHVKVLNNWLLFQR
jgi:hypothetical protein